MKSGKTLAGAILALCILALPATADRRPGWSGDDVSLVTTRTQAAINTGLAYLASVQNPDGSVGTKAKFKVAVTSFAGMAFLAGGSVPGRGKYGKQIEKALTYILDSVEESGFITRSGDESRMHGQGLATLFLAQVYGMTRQSGRAKLHAALRRAVAKIIEEQTVDGGWGYLPGDDDHEGSITVTSLQALREARNVGFKVKKECLLKALEYLMKSANPNGTFKYRLRGASNHATFPLTAAAVSTMNAFGVYGNPGEDRLFGKRYPKLPHLMRKALTFMNAYITGNPPPDRYYTSFYYYAQFYAAQAYYKSRFNGRRKWREYYTFARDDLLRRRSGSTWTHRRYGRAYATAIATLVLQIPYKYLPSFQR